MMMDDITLEIELDLPLESNDIARYHAYVEAGATERDAWQQVAQDVLGGTGAIVQFAAAGSS